MLVIIYLVGNAAISPPLISGLGSASKIPERYVPVSQGFFVESNATGGSILFENDQRLFVKEAVTGAADNVLFLLDLVIQILSSLKKL